MHQNHAVLQAVRAAYLLDFLAGGTLTQSANGQRMPTVSFVCEVKRIVTQSCRIDRVEILRSKLVTGRFMPRLSPRRPMAL